ncbi:MAG TPA: hypothetical protein VHO24_10820 [Opitutaceae bacterium]|nr:hypothetical protein [Opitutaceae bacterium]
MKISFTLGLLCAAAAGAAAQEFSGAKPLVVHEWGTFTTLSGSDGVLLPGLEQEEHALPPFVHSHSGFSPANKGWSRPLANVTVKMETPVIYFYSPLPQTVDIEVRFEGGSISQWYPERTAGEVVSAPVMAVRNPAAVNEPHVVPMPPIDFAKGYNGSASWRVDVLAPGAMDEDPVQQKWETPELRTAFPSIEHWKRARVAAANKIRGAKGGTEGFIFYRGVGNFALPLRVTASDGAVTIENLGAELIPFVCVYEKRPGRPEGKFHCLAWNGELAAGGDWTVALPKDFDAFEPTPARLIHLPEALVRAGLTPEEAKAMMETWRESYFEREGLRVFWIVPRAFTDRVLPISISPQPEKLERVLVGRTEVLMPDFEETLVREFAADGGKRWRDDRYALAYLARARQLGVVLPPVRP